MPGWQEETGLLDLINGMPARPRPAPVLFAQSNAPAAAPAAGASYPLIGAGEAPAIRTPDTSWDGLRAALGQGTRPSVPQIFNQGTEQHPLATPDDVPRRQSWQQEAYNQGVYNEQRDPERARLRQEIINRHNLSRNLENEYYNMGRGMYTIPRAENIGRFGPDPTQGGGTEGRLAGAAETTAGAHQTEALTRAATAEFGMSSAAARQRFMERFPHATPAQLETLVAGEEARGGFAPTTLRFLGAGAGRPASVFPVQGAPAGASSLLNTAGAAPDFTATANQSVPRLPNTPDIGVGEFMMRLAQSNPGVFGTPANRTALRPYLESRFGRPMVEQAMQGTRSLGPIHSGAGQSILGNLLAAPFRGGRMTPEQEGRAILDAALNRNQF